MVLVARDLQLVDDDARLGRAPSHTHGTTVEMVCESCCVLLVPELLVAGGHTPLSPVVAAVPLLSLPLPPSLGASPLITSIVHRHCFHHF